MTLPMREERSPTLRIKSTMKRGYRPCLASLVVVVGIVASSTENICVEGFQQHRSYHTMPGLAPAVVPSKPSSYASSWTSSSSSSSSSHRAVHEDYEQWASSLPEENNQIEITKKEATVAGPLEESFSRPQNDKILQTPVSLPIRRRQFTNGNKKETIVAEQPWYMQEEYQNKRKLRRDWLTRTTDALVGSEPGSLTKGKWHELTSMLYAWSSFSKSDAEAPLRVESILKRLHEERRAGNEEARADIDMYNRLLDAWACAGLFRTTNPVVASQRAREILVLLQETYESEGDELLMPNEESFNLVLHVVCRTEGPTIARRLLALMEYLHRSGKNPHAKPTRSDYTSVLNAYTYERNPKQQANAGSLAEGFLRHMNITAGITPDTYSYNLAIRAWSRSRRGREAAEHADRILEEMQAPKDIVTYSSVISAWATSGMKSHAVQRAEQLLREIEEDTNLEPTTVVLNSVMSTWVKSRSPGACKRTEEILHEMEQSNEPSIQPDLISYNTHLHALSLQAKKPLMAQKCEDLLQRMEQRYERGEVTFAPNSFTYNLVIEAWSKSPDKDAAMKAANILRQLSKVQNDERAGVEPDSFSFNQVLAALSRSPMKGAAKMAEELLAFMEKAYRTGIHPKAKPDAMGYSSVRAKWRLDCC